MDYSDLDKYRDALSQCNLADDLKSICQQFCDQAEFEFYLFGVCNATSLSAPQITTITNYPDAWFNSYFDDDIAKNDPVVRYCFENISPIRWDKLVTMEQYVNASGELIMRRAHECGLVNGMSVPVKAPSGEVAIFSLSTCHEERIDERMLTALPLSQSFAQMLFESHFRLAIDGEEDSSSPRLSHRERECMFWACEGKTAWEMAMILDITERTVNFHLSSATKKLGASNRQHAVAKAILHGLIKPLP